MYPQKGSARRLLRTSLVYPRSNSGLKLRNLDRAQPLQPAPQTITCVCEGVAAWSRSEGGER
jgi:hypothetical protein